MTASSNGFDTDAEWWFVDVPDEASHSYTTFLHWLV